MSKLVTLQDATTGEQIYPMTLVNSVVDENGNDISTYIAAYFSDRKPTQVIVINTDTTSTCTITGASNAGKSQTIIYTNSSGSDLTVTIPTTYITPTGQAIALSCPNEGYCEVSYLNIGGTVYARGI